MMLLILGVKGIIRTISFKGSLLTYHLLKLNSFLGGLIRLHLLLLSVNLVSSPHVIRLLALKFIAIGLVLISNAFEAVLRGIVIVKTSIA